MPRVKDYLNEEEIKALGPKDEVYIHNTMGGVFSVYLIWEDGQVRYKYAGRSDPDGWGEYLAKARPTMEMMLGKLYRELPDPNYWAQPIGHKIPHRSPCDVAGHLGAHRECLRCGKAYQEEKAR